MGWGCHLSFSHYHKKYKRCFFFSQDGGNLNVREGRKRGCSSYNSPFAMNASSCFLSTSDSAVL